MFKTVKAKLIGKHLFDEDCNSYKIYNSLDCRIQGYYLLYSYKDGYLVAKQLFKRIKFPYYVQRKFIDFIDRYYPKYKNRIQKEKEIL